MQHLWPWLAVVAAGALHGMNPATGWVFAACDLRPIGRSPALRALAPIALGHVVALGVGALAVPAAVQFGLDIDRLMLPSLGVGLLLVAAAHRWLARKAGEARVSGRTAMALCSFVTSTAHGAGWMLVPALMPLCATGLPGHEIGTSGSVLLVLAAVAAHMAAMLASTAAVMCGVRRVLPSGCGWLNARRRAGVQARNQEMRNARQS